ncbi:MAG: OmpH family outer membrane protein [Deltaproteobacteria bacterium]
MRKFILIAAGFLCLGGGSYFLSATWGAPTKDTAEEVPHRVGLIDISYVFSKYEKLKSELEELRAEYKEASAGLIAKQKQGQALQEEINEFTPDSPEFESRRNRLVKLSNELASDKKLMDMDFQKKEAKKYHTAYLEIQDAVEKFCDRYKFTVIIRFSRTDPGSTDPQRVSQLLNQPVVYHRKRDDLSQGVLDYLNQRYLKSAGGGEGKSAAGESRPMTNKPAKKDANLKGASGTDR